MNYHSLIKSLVAEAKSGLQFKRMNPVLKVFVKIALIPLFVLAFLGVCGFYLTLFLYKAISSPLDHLHKVVKGEGKEVKHATQFAVYWISWPCLFILYLFQAAMAITFYFQWFFVMLTVYLATLGGVKWQPFLMDASYPNEESYVVQPGQGGIITFLVFTLVFYSFISSGVMLCLDEYFAEFGSVVAVLGFLGVNVMLFIVNPACFKKRKVEAPVCEEAHECCCECECTPEAE